MLKSNTLNVDTLWPAWVVREVPSDEATCCVEIYNFKVNFTYTANVLAKPTVMTTEVLVPRLVPKKDLHTKTAIELTRPPISNMVGKAAVKAAADMTSTQLVMAKAPKASASSEASSSSTIVPPRALPLKFRKFVKYLHQ